MRSDPRGPLLSEEEARQKWCPISRTLVVVTVAEAAVASAAVNRHEDKIVGLCVVSQCMAWRADSDKRGYCGLAGNPWQAITGATIERPLAGDGEDKWDRDPGRAERFPAGIIRKDR